jgi:hypothetical protein
MMMENNVWHVMKSIKININNYQIHGEQCVMKNYRKESYSTAKRHNRENYGAVIGENGTSMAMA